MNIICKQNYSYKVFGQHIVCFIRPDETEILQLNNIGHNLFLPKFI